MDEQLSKTPAVRQRTAVSKIQKPSRMSRDGAISWLDIEPIALGSDLESSRNGSPLIRARQNRLLHKRGGWLPGSDEKLESRSAGFM